MSDTRTRAQLLAAATADLQAFENALSDVRRAVRRPLTVGRRVGSHIGTHPLPWLAAAVLAGVWLAHRTK